MAHQLTSNTTKLEELKAKVQALPAGKKIQESKTVTPSTSSQTVTPDSGYDGLSKVTVNAMPTATQATPSISVSSGGLITASATQTAGYVAAGTKSATKQLTVQAAQTITPGTSNKTIASGRYLTGTQTIKGDANLVAGNIAKNVTIFGVTGTHEGGEDVSAETAQYTSLLTDLETAIDALPEAGSGGGTSVETCSVTLDTSKVANDYGNLAYVTVENNEIVLKTVYVPAASIISTALPEIVCVKGTSLVLGSSTNGVIGTGGFSVSGGVEAISYAASTLGCTFKITGDGSIAWNS